MAEISLQPDCANCAALCCILLPFDKGGMFAHTKPGGRACKHLTGQNRCKIHGQLSNDGYKGCAQFDCLGAGQRVTALFLRDDTWRQDPDRIDHITRAFSRMREIHERLQYLLLCNQLDLSPATKKHQTNLFDLALAELESNPALLFSDHLADWIKNADAFLADLAISEPQSISRLKDLIANSNRHT